MMISDQQDNGEMDYKSNQATTSPTKPIETLLPAGKTGERILALDTSTVTMAIAVLEGELLIKETLVHADRNHSMYLMPMIQELLRELEMKPADLQGFCVGTGPGSYTGVRIGVTVAKTMAWSLKLPVTGVSSLETLALSAVLNGGSEPAPLAVDKGGPMWIIPLMNARRGQAYTAIFAAESFETASAMNKAAEGAAVDEARYTAVDAMDRTADGVADGTAVASMDRTADGVADGTAVDAMDRTADGVVGGTAVDAMDRTADGVADGTAVHSHDGTDRHGSLEGPFMEAAALIDTDRDLVFTRLAADGIQLMDSWLKRLLILASSSDGAKDKPVSIAFVGEIEGFQELIHSFAAEYGQETIVLPLELHAYPAGRLGLSSLEKGGVQNPHGVVPNYAQLSEAEVNLLANRRGEMR